jgi:hypothetical protein
MAADETLHYKNQSIFHAIGFILVVGVKLLTLEQPINGIRTSDISNRYAHLLLPAPVALTIIRSILYLALAAFVIYQLWLAFWGNHLQELTRLMTHMRHWWLISCVANAGWYFAWHYELMPFAFLLQLLLLVSLIAIHYNFAIGHAVVSRREKWLLQIPFSIYLGWVSFSSLVNLETLMVYWGWNGQLIGMVTWTVLMVGLCAGFAAYMILQHYNITYGLVIIWALISIIIQRVISDGLPVPALTTACYIAIVLVAGTIGWHIYKRKSEI